jgi:hypothetical protein
MLCCFPVPLFSPGNKFVISSLIVVNIRLAVTQLKVLDYPLDYQHGIYLTIAGRRSGEPNLAATATKNSILDQ